MVNDSDHDHQRRSPRELSRRRYLEASALLGAGSVGTLAGCLGRGEPAFTQSVPSGVSASVETQYWHDWPTIDLESPPMDYTARAGRMVEPVTVEYSSEDDPWMREHALLFRRALTDLGASVELIDRPLNQLYAESWATRGLEHMISMSSQGPDPQRGIDPNPFLMRLYKENPSNYTNYWHPRINDLLAEQRQVTDSRERRERLVDEVQRIFAEDVGDIITLFPNVITAVNTGRWSGYVPTPGNGHTGDSFQWTEVNIQPSGEQEVFVKGVTTSMNSLNLPWAGGGAEEKRLKYIYDSLFDVAPDLTVIPGLATSAEFVDDTTVEVDLREGVSWHDGERFDASDVVFSTEYYIENTSTSQATFYEPIESVERLSSHAVRFDLTWPDASFLTQRLVRGTVVPKHRWKDVENPTQYNPSNPIGTGPFEFVEWDQGTQFEVRRNDGHWMFDDAWREKRLGEHAVPGRGIERVIWVNVGNIDAMLGALAQGQLDAIGSSLSNAQANRVASNAGVEKKSTRNFAPVAVKLMHSNPLIRDKEFRVALAKSIDRRSFVEEVLLEEGYVPEGENYISKLTEWHNPDTPDYDYDPEEARRILERAGYLWDDSGTLHFPNGEAWGAFVERVQNGTTHERREALGQPDFSNTETTTDQ